MTFYNMIFTAFPLAAKAVFDQDIYYLGLEKRNGRLKIIQIPGVRSLLPYVYRIGQIDAVFNSFNFLLWITKGIVHGFFIWLTCVFTVQDGPILGSDGLTGDFWFVSVTLFTSVYVVATLQNVYMVRYWTIFNVISLTFLSLACYIAWVFIEDSLYGFEIYSNQHTIWASPIFYLVILLNAGWFTMYEYAEMFLREWVSQSATSKARLLVKSGALIKMSQNDIAQTFEIEKGNRNKIRQKDSLVRIN